MDSFLDTTVIIKYLEYGYIKESLRKRCFEHITASKNKVFISFIVKNELDRVVLQRKEMYEYILKKIKDPSYELDHKKTIYLNKQDILFIQEFCLKLKDKDTRRLKQDFESEIDFLRVSLDIFLKNKVNEIAIAKSDLDSFALSLINDSLNDFADSRVLTSAIQMQKNKDIFFFVTADKHFSPNEYEFIRTEPRLKDYKFPKLKNLLYET